MLTNDMVENIKKLTRLIEEHFSSTVSNSYVETKEN